MAIPHILSYPNSTYPFMKLINSLRAPCQATCSSQRILGGLKKYWKMIVAIEGLQSWSLWAQKIDPLSRTYLNEPSTCTTRSQTKKDRSPLMCAELMWHFQNLQPTIHSFGPFTTRHFDSWLPSTKGKDFLQICNIGASNGHCCF